MKKPDILPYAVSLEDITGIEELADSDTLVDPETLIISSDHTGVMNALRLLTPRQQQFLREKSGLNTLGEPLSNAEIAKQFGITLNTVAHTLCEARDRLRSADDIVHVINGDYVYNPADDNSGEVSTNGSH